MFASHFAVLYIMLPMLDTMGLNGVYFLCTVDHNISAAWKFRKMAPMYIFETQNFRECAGTYTKKKNNYAKRSSRYNNVRSAMEALSLKLPGVSS